MQPIIIKYPWIFTKYNLLHLVKMEFYWRFREVYKINLAKIHFSIFFVRYEKKKQSSEERQIGAERIASFSQK